MAGDIVALKLPKDLKPIHIEKAVDYVERETIELVDIYLEQANVFTGIVGIMESRRYIPSVHTRNTSIRT
jgi:hypothetical protein